MSLRRARAALLLLLAASACWAQEPGRWTLAGGHLAWDLDERALAALELRLEAGWEPVSKGRPAGSLEAELAAGGFRAFAAGSLGFSGGPRLRHPGGVVDLSDFRLLASGEAPSELAIADLDGRRWFILRMGHHWTDRRAGVLRAEFLDLWPGPALAALRPSQAATPLHLGSVAIAGEILEAGLDRLRPKGLCRAPVWPGDGGAVADLRMTAMNQVAQIADFPGMAPGLVYLAPAATFVVAGSADLPWYSRFADPGNEPDCLDDGSGRCQPYGESQGGFLVWNVYHLDPATGELRQLARSGVKHAFNSINQEPAGGGQSCGCVGSARVAFVGCEDLYAVSTNSDPNFLGPRGELRAAEVAWEGCGSVFDRDCDAICDSPRGGLIPCNAVNDDIAAVQTGVPETILERGDPLFIESWYLVRDDVDIFNSMGNHGLAATAIGSAEQRRWSFTASTPFATGTVLQRLAAEAGRTVAPLETGRGVILLDGRSQDLGDGWTRFSYTLMNVSFDPRLDRFVVPLAGVAALREIRAAVADPDRAGRWVATVPGGEVLRWEVDGEALPWGAMVSFSFEAQAPAAAGPVGLGVAGEETFLGRAAPRPAAPADRVFGSSFEAPF